MVSCDEETVNNSGNRWRQAGGAQAGSCRFQRFQRRQQGGDATLGEGIVGIPMSETGAAVGIMAVVGEGVSSTGATIPRAGDKVWVAASVRIPGESE